MSFPTPNSNSVTGGWMSESGADVAHELGIECEICGAPIALKDSWGDAVCVTCGSLYSYDESYALSLTPAQIDCLQRHMGEWRK